MTLPGTFDAWKLDTPPYLEEARTCPECGEELDDERWCQACDQDHSDEPDPDRHRDE